MKRFSLLSIAAVFFINTKIDAQEYIVPLDHNVHRSQSITNTANKPTANTLPFFEDFTGNFIFPEATKWADHSVYVNNTMGRNVISRGVATFDALNEKGGPYDSVTATSLLYADSLTALPFDLSIYQPGDSLYLSFFYQPQGNGFAPEVQDSLMLYLKKPTNIWTKVWSMDGKLFQPFTQVMIAVTDSDYFHVDFQFRFVNKASINVNDDVWNVDYIRFSANRNINDTAIRDVATTVQPTNILNDYTSLPYRHFAADMSSELAMQHSFTAQNNYNLIQSVTSGYVAKETTTNTTLFSGTSSSSNLAPYATQLYQFPMYNVNFSPPNPYYKVIFENKYFATVAIPEPKTNDTIVHHQIFDNYLAYDDGSAERSYFLKQSATLPAKLAVEYHLNQPDTLRGFAVYFGRQVPLGSGKFFNVEVFKDIAFNGGSDDLIYDQPLFFPSYADTVNNFWTYKLDQPVPLQTGAFYLSLLQPANSGSDSLYYGLDVNRISSNHAYFNVLNKWESSAVSGAIMIRPILGRDFIPSPVNDTKNVVTDWSIYPNPAEDKIHIRSPWFKASRYEITDIQGRKIISASCDENTGIPVANLLPGLYFIRIFNETTTSIPQKFLKL